jgi:hypothetical protein
VGIIVVNGSLDRVFDEKKSNLTDSIENHLSTSGHSHNPIRTTGTVLLIDFDLRPRTLAQFLDPRAPLPNNTPNLAVVVEEAELNPIPTRPTAQILFNERHDLIENPKSNVLVL